MKDKQEAYERSMKGLIDRIKYLVVSKKITDDSALAYETMINDVIDYVNHLEEKLDELLLDLDKLSKRKIAINQEYIDKLEAIILLHGIYNANALLLQSVELLREQAVRNDRERCWQMPSVFRQQITLKKYEELKRSYTTLVHGKSENSENKA